MVRHSIPSRLSTQAVRAARTSTEPTAANTSFLSASKLQRTSAQSAQATTGNGSLSVEPTRSYHTSSPSHFTSSAPAPIASTPPVRATVRSRLPDDEVTLRYYVERKAALDQSTGRKSSIPGDLMPNLAASIRSAGLDASITPRKHKVPLEFQDAHGSILHPSGFAPPTPGQFHFEAGVVHDGYSRFGNHSADRMPDILVPPNKAGFFAIEDKAAMYAARAYHSAAGARKTTDMKPPVPRASFRTSAVRPARQRESDEDIALRFYVERKAQREQVEERKAIEGDLMPTLSATVLSEGFDAAIVAKEEKIPVEVVLEDGTVQHASGFVPPTPAEVHESIGVVAHGLQAHDAARVSHDGADFSHTDAVPAESRGHREDVPAGQTKPRAPPLEPSGMTASSFGARAL